MSFGLKTSFGSLCRRVSTGAATKRAIAKIKVKNALKVEYIS